jgi:hypothetical protein
MFFNEIYDEGQRCPEKDEEITYVVKLVGNVAQHNGRSDVGAVDDRTTMNFVMVVGCTATRREVGDRGMGVSDLTAHIIDVRLDSVWRVWSTLAVPCGDIHGGPMNSPLIKS